MATEKKIILTVGKDGSTEIEAQGFPDGTCLKETASVEEALGKVTSQSKKPEAYIPPKVEQKIPTF